MDSCRDQDQEMVMLTVIETTTEMLALPMRAPESKEMVISMWMPTEKGMETTIVTETATKLATEMEIATIFEALIEMATCMAVAMEMMPSMTHLWLDRSQSCVIRR